MRKVIECVVLVVSLAMHGPSLASGNVFLEAAFETGQIQSKHAEFDGFYIQTLPNPQSGSEWIGSGSGGFGPTTNWDTRVVSKETIGGQVVLPRAGKYFLRSAIYWTKDYSGLNGNGEDKPRQGMLLTTPAQRFDFDEEAWVGFSIFLPSNWEHEQGRNDHRGGASLFVINATPSASFVTLTQYVPNGATKAHWFFKIQTSDSTATESGDYLTEYLDLGSVEPDLGKWTDFVVRARANPFKTTTNPYKAGISGSRNQTYEGNKGIVQVWKSEGKDRAMSLKVNRVNTPVGLVPREGNDLLVKFQIYKGAWRKNPTTVKGPIWVGYDEIRFGSTTRHGTGFADVDPSGTSQSSAAPRPPSMVVE